MRRRRQGQPKVEAPTLTATQTVTHTMTHPDIAAGSRDGDATSANSRPKQPPTPDGGYGGDGGGEGRGSFPSGKGGGKIKTNGKLATDLGPVTMTLMGTAGAMVETTTHDEQEGDPPHPGGTHPATRRCLPDIGEERGKKYGSRTFPSPHPKYHFGWTFSRTQSRRVLSTPRRPSNGSTGQRTTTSTSMSWRSARLSLPRWMQNCALR